MKLRHFNLFFSIPYALWGLWLIYDGSWSDRIIGYVLVSLGLILLGIERIIAKIEESATLNRVMLYKFITSSDEFKAFTMDERIKVLRKVMKDE